MALRDVVDQLHDDDRFSDAGAAEESDLSSLHERSDQINDLDARLEDFGLGLEVRELWGGPVDRLAEHVENPAEGSLADWNGDRTAGILDSHPADDGVGRRHRHRAHLVAADVLLHLDDDVNGDARIGLLTDAESVVKLGQVLGLEFDVEHGSDDLHDFTKIRLFLFGGAKLLLGADGRSHWLPL